MSLNTQEKHELHYLLSWKGTHGLYSILLLQTQEGGFFLQLGFFRGFSVVIDNYLITSLARGGPHAVGAGDMAKLHPAMEVHVRFQQVATQQTG